MNIIQKIIDKENFYKNLPSFPDVLLGNLFDPLKNKVYIFGFCEFGFKIANALTHSHLNVSGYFDNDDSKTDLINEGGKCIHVNNFDENKLDCYVIIAVAENIESVQSQLILQGFCFDKIVFKRSDRESLGNNFHNYLINCIVGTLAWFDKSKMRSTILEDEAIISATYLKLADEKSKNIFIARIALALDGERYGPLNYFLNEFSDTVIENRDIYGDSYYAPRPLPEFKYYFNQKFLHLTDGEVYVDVGAEDGNTIIPFIQRMIDLKKNYSEIYAFEPDPIVFQILKRALENQPAITLFQEATGDVDGLIGFTPSVLNLQSRLCGTVNDDSDYFVNSVTLDELFNRKKYTLIKIDPSG
jgi:FkbM family methyltransferase